MRDVSIKSSITMAIERWHTCLEKVVQIKLFGYCLINVYMYLVLGLKNLNINLNPVKIDFCDFVFVLYVPRYE